jgi:hypothetical protein
METTEGPPEHKKYCVNVSHSGHHGMHYVARITHWMQKHKFGITCPSVLFVESVTVPPKKEK